MARWSRREAIGAACAGAVSLPSGWAARFWDRADAIPDDDYRDCLVVLATYHVPELESISISANFHAIVNYTSRLKAMSSGLRSDPENVMSLVSDAGLKSGLTARQLRAVGDYLHSASNLGNGVVELLGQKSAFETRLQESAFLLRQGQESLLTSLKLDVAGPNDLDWKIIAESLRELLGRCRVIHELISAAPQDQLITDLWARLEKVENFIRSCLTMVEKGREQDMTASLNPSPPDSVPSLSKCEEIVKKYVSPCLWWPAHVRGAAKPAFNIVDGRQALVDERRKMITDALMCVNFFLARHCGEIAAEVAKGG